LQRELQSLQSQLPELLNNNSTQFKQWWKTQGQAWIKQLRDVMIEHRNIGQDWQFSDEQQELLLKYYTANQFLVECLKNPSVYVTKETRQQVEAELLLPVPRDQTAELL
jgi:hypothetical protein